MVTDGLAVVSKLSTKFVHEALPVALATVVGTLLVNHYCGRQASPPVVVQAASPANADELVKTLRDEQAVIAEYLKHEAEAAPAKSAPALATKPIVTTYIADDPPEPPARPAALRKAAPRPTAKVAADKKPAVAPPPVPVAVDHSEESVATQSDAGWTPPVRAEGAIAAVHDWIGSASGLPARVLLLPFAERTMSPWGLLGGGPRFN
jgi:hypothetical protein